MNNNESKCGVVILNYNSYDLTVALANKVANFESVSDVCVVDNCSKDNFDGIFTHPKIHYIKNKINAGYSAGNNIGLKYLIEIKGCNYVWIANPDVIFENSTITKMRDCMKDNNEIALISTKRYGPNHVKIHQFFEFLPLWTSIQNCFFLPRKRNERERFIRQNNMVDNAKGLLYVDAVPGAFFGIQADFLRKNNYLYEGIFLYGEELILGRQAYNAGYKAAVINTDEYIHDHHQYRFSNRKMFWLDHKSLLLYYRMFNILNPFEYCLLYLAVVLGTIEYNCAFFANKLINKIKS